MARLLAPKALRQRALAAGADAEEVEDARDADDPKAALISLLLRRHADGAHLP
jgi:hypothetical protein